MEISVKITIKPLPSEISAAEMDRLFDGEVSAFEKWFRERQQAHGFRCTGLLSSESGILKSYLYYLRTIEDAPLQNN